MWILDKTEPYGQLIQVRKEVLRLIKVFDSKPFILKCFGCKRRPATRFSLAIPNSSPYWWCDVCSPRSMGCDGLLTVGKTYQVALQYAERYLRKGHTKSLIRVLAEAKGLPKRVGETQSVNFFDAV